MNSDDSQSNRSRRPSSPLLNDHFEDRTVLRPMKPRSSDHDPKPPQFGLGSGSASQRSSPLESESGVKVGSDESIKDTPKSFNRAAREEVSVAGEARSVLSYRGVILVFGILVCAYWIKIKLKPNKLDSRPNVEAEVEEIVRGRTADEELKGKRPLIETAPDETPSVNAVSMDEALVQFDRVFFSTQTRVRDQRAGR